MTIREGEIPIDEAVVRSLLAAQCPQWAGLPLSRAGAGTDNTMFRLGDDLLVRMPRTAFNAGWLRKEQHWLPRLAPHLPLEIPVPVHAGTPAAGYPLPWSVYHWIDGEEAGPGTVRDWAAFGRDLAGFVRTLHGTDLMGATREDDLVWYRGGSLHDCDEWISRCFADCAGAIPGLGALEEMWRAAVALPDPVALHVWLHADLKPTNLLVRDGALRAVIDFGGLSVGFPDAEHATVWDLPHPARAASRSALDLDDETWARARGWAIAVGVSGLSFYRDTFPSFVSECRSRLAAIATGDSS